MDIEFASFDLCYVIIVEVDGLTGVFDDSRGIRSDNGAIFSNSQNDGRASTGHDESAWFGVGHAGNTERSFDFFERGDDCIEEIALVERVDEVGEDFGVGFGKEKVSGRGEFITEGTMVFNDAVVNERDAVFSTCMWVRVLGGWWSVGGPAGVGDAAIRFREVGFVLAEEAREFLDLAFAFTNDNLVFGFYGDTGGVVAAIFESFETADEDGKSRAYAGVCYDAAHDLRFVNVVTNDFAGECGGAWAEFATGVEGGVDTGMNVGADNSSELTATSVDEIAFDGGAMIGSIVAEVGGDGSGSEVGLGTDVAIADVAEMTDGSAVAEDGVFDFDALADVAIVADARGATEIAVRADFAVLSDDDASFDEDAGEDFGPFANNNFGAFSHLNGVLSGPVGDGGHNLFVDVKEVPGEFWREEFAEGGFPLGEVATSDEEFVVRAWEGPE